MTWFETSPTLFGEIWSWQWDSQLNWCRHQLCEYTLHIDDEWQKFQQWILSFIIVTELQIATSNCFIFNARVSDFWCSCSICSWCNLIWAWVWIHHLFENDAGARQLSSSCTTAPNFQAFFVFPLYQQLVAFQLIFSFSISASSCFNFIFFQIQFYLFYLRSVGLFRPFPFRLLQFFRLHNFKLIWL